MRGKKSIRRFTLLVMERDDDAAYLIDFYHVSKYLGEADTCCSLSRDGSLRRAMQALMKDGEITTVLDELKLHS